MRKSLLFSCALVGIASAISEEKKLKAIGARLTPGEIAQRHPSFGQNSNDPEDPGFKRDFPDFAHPKDQGKRRPALIEEELPRDHIPKAVLNAQKAIRDPVMAKIPDIKILNIPGHQHVYIPIEPATRVYKSPVFLVDPKFTNDMKEEDKVCYEDNDHAGHN